MVSNEWVDVMGDYEVWIIKCAMAGNRVLFRVAASRIIAIIQVGIALFILDASNFILSAHAQDLEMRRTNSLGNWVAYLNNNGSLFNQSDSDHSSKLGFGAGGLWTGLGRYDTLVFGAGLWIGGLRNRSDTIEPHSEFSYDPNTAQSEFAAGSFIYDGAATDTSQAGRDRYRIYRSDDLVGPAWPVRLIAGKAAYVDDPTQRTAAGPKAVVGDEDMFLVYKDSDPDSIADPFGLEIRTTASFWRSGMLENVTLVRNEIIYSGTDTIFDPVVALALDGDINNPDDDRTKGVHDEATTASVFFTTNSSTDPLLGVIALGGQYGTHREQEGITSLRYWDLNEDPATDSERYTFLTAPHWDTALTAPGDARVLISSLSQTSIVPGDTLDFDYAIYAEPPNGPAFSAGDSATMLGIARTLSSDYRTGEFQPSSVLSRPKSAENWVYPNPANTRLNFSGGIIPVELYDALGRKITVSEAAEAGSGYFNVQNLEPGVYFVRSGNQIQPFEVQH